MSMPRPLRAYRFRKPAKAISPCTGPARSSPAPDDPVTLSISRDAVYLFDRDGQHLALTRLPGNAAHSKH